MQNIPSAAAARGSRAQLLLWAMQGCQLGAGGKGCVMEKVES